MKCVAFEIVRTLSWQKAVKESFIWHRSKISRRAMTSRGSATMAPAAPFKIQVSLEEAGTRRVLSVVDNNNVVVHVAQQMEEKGQLKGKPETATITFTKQENTAAGSALISPSGSSSPATVTMPPYEWKSTISVCDTGTEVTLDEENGGGNLVTPRKERGRDDPLDDDPSLLDEQTPENESLSWGGVYGSCLAPLNQSKSPQSKDIARKGQESCQLHGCILQSLGSHEEGDDWQNLLPSMADALDEDEENRSPSPHQLRVMHNRTMHAGSKLARLDKLRQNLHPFQQHKDPNPLKTSSTFSAPSRDSQVGSTEESGLAATQNGSDWQWNACDAMYHDEGASSRLVDVDENACYDSDPEDYQGTTSTEQLKHQENEIPLADTIDHTNEEEIRDLIETIFKERWTFILHPAYGTPIGIEAWLERGQRLKGLTLAPKLIWLPLHEKSRKSEPKTESDFAGLDLLDVQRILQMGRVDRKKYALAKPRRTFMVRTVRGDYCLECRSMAERDQFVTQLKIAVARFGSQLVAADPAVEEFFSPPGGKVIEPEF